RNSGRSGGTTNRPPAFLFCGATRGEVTRSDRAVLPARTRQLTSPAFRREIHVHHHALSGARRHPRAHMFFVVLVGLTVAAGVVSPASAASDTTNAFVSAPQPASDDPVAAAAPVPPTAVRTAVRQATTTAVWADRRSVRAGETVRVAGQVTHGA